MNTFPYQITVHWSEVDQSYEAEIPALRTCIAYGDTADEAVREVKIAADAMLEVMNQEGRPIPLPEVTVERLTSLGDLINLAALARQAGIPNTTLASKLKRGTALTADERGKIEQVLSAYGIR